MHNFWPASGPASWQNASVTMESRRASQMPNAKDSSLAIFDLLNAKDCNSWKKWNRSIDELAAWLLQDDVQDSYCVFSNFCAIFVLSLKTKLSRTHRFIWQSFHDANRWNDVFVNHFLFWSEIPHMILEIITSHTFILQLNKCQYANPIILRVGHLKISVDTISFHRNVGSK